MFNFSSSVPSGQYVYLGFQEGSFTPQGETLARDYKNIFVLSSPSTSSNRRVVGYASEKLRILNTDILNDFLPGDLVQLFFDQYGRVQTVLKVK